MKLYDSYCRAQRLKKSLSADAVHGFKLDTAQTPQVHRALTLHTCTDVYSSFNKDMLADRNVYGGGVV